jgi:predicted DNA-binding transcriptional regulator AlpA
MATDPISNGQALPQAPAASPLLSPLAVDIKGLASLLQRSVASLHRDNAAGRLPSPVRIGGSVRWRVSDIESWLSWNCCSANEFAARLAAQHNGRT